MKGAREIPALTRVFVEGAWRSTWHREDAPKLEGQGAFREATIHATGYCGAALAGPRLGAQLQRGDSAVGSVMITAFFSCDISGVSRRVSLRARGDLKSQWLLIARSVWTFWNASRPNMTVRKN